MTGERIVEIEWEDAAQTHGWQKRIHLPAGTDTNRSVGYVVEENDQHILVTESLAPSDVPDGVSPSPYGCTLIIPRSAIRHVWELRRKR